MSYERFTESQTWYVVFNPSHGRFWWSNLVNSKFQHVSMWREVEGGCIHINPLSHTIMVQFYAGSLEWFIKQELEQHCTALLSQTVHYGMLYQPSPVEIMSCVSVAKRLLGIRKRIYTPYGIYKEMLKMGAKIIQPYIPLAKEVNYL